mmetsp:Transcript_90055/g.291443  ORF Transcript_90055/g.291443 Transcript_90055/m.291443 type:complete len:234 (-) Transcript_90055:2040-2741(-)
MAAFRSSSTWPATDKPTPRSRPRSPRPRSSGDSTDSPSCWAPGPTTAPTLSMPLSFFSTSPMVLLACWIPRSSSWRSLCGREVHSINGSAMKTCSTDSKVCWFARSRKTSMQSSQDLRKTPSMPVTPMAATQFCVSLKGTVSGRSRSIPLPKRQSKSTCTMRPDSVSRRIFSPWRSPSPSMYPSMHQRACDLLYVRRLNSHTDGSALMVNHRCNTGGCRGKTCLVKVSYRSLL